MRLEGRNRADIIRSGLTLIALVAFWISFSACGDSGQSIQGDGHQAINSLSMDSLDGSEWQLLEVNGKSILDSASINIRFLSLDSNIECSSGSLMISSETGALISTESSSGISNRCFVDLPYDALLNRHQVVSAIESGAQFRIDGERLILESNSDHFIFSRNP